MNMVSRRTLLQASAIVPLALASVLAAAAGPAAAQGQSTADMILSPAVAHARAEAGQLVLVDIRTPAEWRETGVPASAKTITMHQDGSLLLAALEAATGGEKTRQLALICRTGNRTAYLQGELKKRGYTSVINVAEGVVGGPHGPGWLKAGLPIRQPQ